MTTPNVHPPLEEIERFATKLNDGEQRVLDLLIDHLDDEWHVFVQPHLLSHQPDFLLVAEHHGVTVIEVKDWADKGHRVGDGGRLEVRAKGGTWQLAEEDPLAKVHQYRSVVAELLLEPPGSPSMFSHVRGVAMFPRWSAVEARNMVRATTGLTDGDKMRIRVAGRESFGDAQFDALKGDKPSGELEPAVYERLLKRLEEPEATSDQRLPLHLSEGTRNVEANRTRATIRRVRGPAGSGKTLGLAARAARLAGEGKRVLVLTFNLTLAHYVQDLVRRHARSIGADHRLVDCVNIHEFCASLLRGRRMDSDSDGDDEAPDAIIVRTRRLYEDGATNLLRYDAVLVDEGQDFAAEWWNFLREHVRRTDVSEMLLAVDVSQDLYDRSGWTEEESMLGCGFAGPWTELRGSYRLPVDLTPVVAEFADTYLQHHVFDPPTVPSDHGGLAAAPTLRRWVNTAGSPDDIAGAVLGEIRQLWNSENAPHEADTIYLTNDHRLGLRIAAEVTGAGIALEHIFVEGTDLQKRRAKRRFWPGVAKLKGCTVHSFKGWEARAVIVVIHGDPERAAELAYVALTRVKGDPANRSAFVTVVNNVREFNGFKSRFERHIGPEEVEGLGGQTGLGL